MKESRITMGMPATVEVVDDSVTAEQIESVYRYFTSIDDAFSTYKETSEISRLNRGELAETEISPMLRFVLDECEKIKQETSGYFDILHNGKRDPSGYVKGWAIQKAAELLAAAGFHNYYVEIGGDLQVAGHTAEGTAWRIGIRNPFNRAEIIKRISLNGQGMATSGTAVRGQHIYNPQTPEQPLEEIVSLTVIGPAIVDADRYATAAFAMGKGGIEFIASLPGFEAYQIDAHGIATFTPGFKTYVI